MDASIFIEQGTDTRATAYAIEKFNSVSIVIGIGEDHLTIHAPNKHKLLELIKIIYDAAGGLE